MMPIRTETDCSECTLTLRRLIVLRWCLLAGEVAAIVGLPALLDIALPRAPMLLVVGLQLLANGLLARRLRGAGSLGDSPLFVQLVLDIVALSVLMFFSGGAANPLVSLLLPPVAIAALALPARPVAAIAGLAVAAYSLLNVVYLPLPIADAGRAARLHLAGMWFSFVVSVAMLGWFVVRMTASIRQRDAELAEVREKSLRDERVIALGALAAGAAHELSTPLATMAIVAGELDHDPALGADARADVAVLRRQIAACKEIISRLAGQAGAERLDAASSARADEWLSGIFQRWLALRPHHGSDLQLTGNAPAPRVIADTRLEQGLLNLFNNAADAAPAVDVVADWDSEWLTIEVRDRGPGFAAEVLERAGRAPFPGHAGGTGIGLFLAQAAISRLGGQLTLFNDGGGVARIELPARGKG